MKSILLLYQVVDDDFDTIYEKMIRVEKFLNSLLVICSLRF